MHFARILFASAFAALASAQTIRTSSASSVAASTTVAQSMPPAATNGFNAAIVSNTTKFQWCNGQRNNCPQICGGAASSNVCDPATLTYSCTCPNGTVPDVTAYAETLPFFICEETFAQCMNNTPSTDPQGQAVCMSNHQCGTRNATAEALAVTAGSSATTASRTSGAASSATGSGAGASSTTAAAAGAAMTTYTSGIFAAVLMAALKLLL